jgi:hypothetical protein
MCKSHAVGGAGDDSTGVSGSFAKYEKAFCIYAFESFVVTCDAER